MSDPVVNNNNIPKERMFKYISYAQNIVNDYYKMKIKCFDISLVMISLLVALYTLIINILDKISISAIILGLFNLVVFFGNMLYFLLEKRTLKNVTQDKKWKTNWFYRGHIINRKQISDTDYKNFISRLEGTLIEDDKKQITKPDHVDSTNRLKDPIIEDDKKQLFILYFYANHYYKIAYNMRKILLIGMISFCFIPINYLIPDINIIGQLIFWLLFIVVIVSFIIILFP